jgi:hypothetical protein
MACQVPGAQSELAVGEGADGQRRTVDQPDDSQATRREKQGRELDRQPELQRLYPVAHALISARI